MSNKDFCSALTAPIAVSPVPDEYDWYSWLVGSWDFDWVDHREGREGVRARGEWHFAWIIEGQAIQDVFICPSKEEGQNYCLPDCEYGTTVRVFDPVGKIWDIFYTTIGRVGRFTARREKDGSIVQECVNSIGFMMRWVFSDITPDSFRWSNVTSRDDGRNWELQGELFATRRGTGRMDQVA